MPAYFSMAWNFNPRSREGSDVDIQAKAYLVSFISIHAPAKGATNFEW